MALAALDRPTVLEHIWFDFECAAKVYTDLEWMKARLEWEMPNGRYAICLMSSGPTESVEC